MSDQDRLNLPQHRNPNAARAHEDRVASAPYNFVPLPEQVVTAVTTADQLPDHDRFGLQPDRYSGYFTVRLETLSPLFVRGMLSTQPRKQGGSEYDQAEAEKMGQQPPNGDFHLAMKNKPEFFFTRREQEPVIPGSSLRGMLRSLLEIVSYSKVQWVTDKQLFFRTVDDTAVGVHYRDRMVQMDKGQDDVTQKGKVKVEGGFLRYDREKDRYFIKKCQVRRIPREADEKRPTVTAGTELYDGKPPSLLPRWKGQPHQHQPCWVQLTDDGSRLAEVRWQQPADLVGWEEARLVITGDMNNKKAEFVFILPPAGADEIDVAEALIDRFHDDDQISQWQQKAFPKDKPAANGRERDGMLPKKLGSVGEPVFFLREPGSELDADGNAQLALTFFGRACMFRLPYHNSPLDLVCPDLRRTAEVDFAEALFGYVKPKKSKKHPDGIDAPQGSKALAYAGRVFVTDAALNANQSDIFLETFDPKILATPKPTAFQQYLVQSTKEEEVKRYRRSLSHYDSPTIIPPKRRDGRIEPEILSPATVIRGQKMYWHQGEVNEADLKENNSQALGNDGRVKPGDTQHTQLRPVKAHKHFTFRVHFENLSAAELGALCWVLHPLGAEDKAYRHSLGMGKPLGMGAVELKASLHLTNRAQRYAELFSGEQWQTATPETGADLSQRVTLLAQVKPFEDYVLAQLQPAQPCQHLYQLKRIGMLLKLLEWPGIAPRRDLDPDNRVGNTRYMSIQANTSIRDRRNEYKHRPVLPDPEAFGPLTGTVTLDGRKTCRPEALPRPDLNAARVVKQSTRVEAPSVTPKAAPIDPIPEVRAQVSAEAEATLADGQRLAEEREAKEARKRQLKAEKEARQKGKKK